MIRAYLKVNRPYAGVTLNITDSTLYVDRGFTLDTGNFIDDFSILYLLAEEFAGKEIYLAPSMDQFLTSM